MNATNRVLTHLARAHYVVQKKEQDKTHERAQLQEEQKRAQAAHIRQELVRAAQERRELTHTLEMRKQQAHIAELKQDVHFLTQRVQALRETLSSEQLRGVEQLIARIHEKIKEKEKKMEKT